MTRPFVCSFHVVHHKASASLFAIGLKRLVRQPTSVFSCSFRKLINSGLQGNGRFPPGFNRVANLRPRQILNVHRSRLCQRRRRREGKTQKKQKRGSHRKNLFGGTPDRMCSQRRVPNRCRSAARCLWRVRCKGWFGVHLTLRVPPRCLS